MKSSNVDMAELKEIVADIRRDNVRASEVILRLRSLLKKAPFQPKDADLNQIVNETVEFLSALAVARRVEMRTSMTSAPLPIRGDRIQLQQVILNLIVNAMDAMANMPVAETPDQGLDHALSMILPKSRSSTTVPASLVTNSRKCLSHFSPRRKTAWEWVCRSLEQSSKRMRGGCRSENQPSGGAAFRFGSACRIDAELAITRSRRRPRPYGSKTCVVFSMRSAAA